MPAALNIRPKKRADIKGMLKHDFRQYDPEEMPPRIDASRLAYNRILHGSAGALNDLPERQPDTGRKIRVDANLAASMILTLPKELGAEDVEQWANASVQWLQQECPGRLAYAVLHQDESRPHIHAAVVPEDEKGHVSYKVPFDGRGKLRMLQKSYAEALAPLGVESNPEHIKAIRRTQYTRGVNGWRVLPMVQELEAREQALEKDLKAQRDSVPFSLPDVSIRDLESARRYRERIKPWFESLQRAALAERLQVGSEVRKELTESERKVQMLEHQLRQKEYDLAKTEAMLTPEQKHQLEQKSRVRWTRDREQDLGL